MSNVRDEYIPPVGFAREPHAERRRWLGRIGLLLFLVLIGYILWFRVLHVPSDNPSPGPSEPTTLPAPV